MTAADGRAHTTDGDRETVHELKTWPTYFAAVLDGSKTFELRKDDRGFAVGDVLRLREWSEPIPDWSVKGGYTGRAVTRRVIYVLDDAEDFGLMPGFVILGLAAERRRAAEDGQRLRERVEARIDALAADGMLLPGAAAALRAALRDGTGDGR